MMETSPAGRPDTLPAGSGNDWITACESAHCAKVKFLPGGDVLIGSTKHDTELRFTQDEWLAFVEGVNLGEFNYPA